MKVALPTSNGDTKRKLHILPLVPDEEADALTKANSLTFDLPTITGDNDSPKYKLSIRVIIAAIPCLKGKIVSRKAPELS